jgi:hypothetical protein
LGERFRVRLVRLGLIEGPLSRCAITQWRGSALSLCLHHVNDDNRLENLRLLCRDCHSQTAKFAGRNRART